MSVRIERGQAKLLTRTGLDWSAKYPSMVAALAAVGAKTAYLDGELCGVGEDGLPNFAETQAATDGPHGVRLVFYAFDLLHLDGRGTTALPLVEHKALLEGDWRYYHVGDCPRSSRRHGNCAKPRYRISIIEVGTQEPWIHRPRGRLPLAGSGASPVSQAGSGLAVACRSADALQSATESHVFSSKPATPNKPLYYPPKPGQSFAL
jgi:hypothetical protein